MSLPHFWLIFIFTKNIRFYKLGVFFSKCQQYHEKQNPTIFSFFPNTKAAHAYLLNIMCKKNAFIYSDTN